jgi:transposase
MSASADSVSLLTHGTRSVLRAATQTNRTLDHLRRWATSVQARSNHNKATCALANKLARIAARRCVTLNRTVNRRLGSARKMQRTAFALPG